MNRTLIVLQVHGTALFAVGCSSKHVLWPLDIDAALEALSLDFEISRMMRGLRHELGQLRRRSRNTFLSAAKYPQSPFWDKTSFSHRKVVDSVLSELETVTGRFGTTIQSSKHLAALEASLRGIGYSDILRQKQIVRLLKKQERVRRMIQAALTNLKDAVSS